MAKETKMNYDEAEDLKRKFYAAESDLEGNKNDFPDDVDGGEGNDYIVAMLTTIAEEAGDIATASGLGGDKLGAAIDKVRGVDESVAQTFQSMAEEMQ
ncbi:hypothetical protein BKH13_05890 [Actinomyces naeslundii]|jgi:hypothetical protein|uniref:Uncharacterized protein n=1 Tax=Actinomyces naeslundii TaxID=1655 RepID=A0ABX3EZV6_ACTNA|nr:hypothetical protein [Actinomyces naeslundii]OLO83928.1 hypothetical protein BKH13_05890 [Actinomyces naeslundii]OLO91273.1 hypothetical protein BKH10_02955 [Actinomyces naeslundii]